MNLQCDQNCKDGGLNHRFSPKDEVLPNFASSSDDRFPKRQTLYFIIKITGY